MTHHTTAFAGLFAIVLVGMAAWSAPPPSATEDKLKADKLQVYVGTYTSGKSKGIYLMELDLSTGALSAPELAAEVSNPSFLAIHPSRKFLYAVGEMNTFDGKKSGAVSAFAIDPKTGKLTLLNQQASQGGGPCHLVTDKHGRHVLVANYGGGSVAALPIQEDGKLGAATGFVQHKGSSVNPRRQEGPHAHSINLDAANRFAVVADLGLDQLLVYRFDPTKGTLTANEPPSASVAAGSGPRHFAFHPTVKYAFAINELTSTLTAFSYDSQKGVLKQLQTLSTLPQDFKGNNSTAEVQVHPSGKFVYGSNRGHDSIAIFAFDPETGKMTAAGHESTQGKTPRNFALDPTGTYLLAENQASDSIVVFRIDSKTGALKATGHKVEIPSPVCVRMIPATRP